MITRKRLTMLITPLGVELEKASSLENIIMPERLEHVINNLLLGLDDDKAEPLNLLLSIMKQDMVNIDNEIDDFNVSLQETVDQP